MLDSMEPRNYKLNRNGNSTTKPGESDVFLRDGTQTLNPRHSLDYALYFNDLCTPIEIYIYARKKYPFTSSPAAKHPKHCKFAIKDMQENAVDSF